MSTGTAEAGQPTVSDAGTWTPPIEGPGINDNGSGSATALEVALQMAELGTETRNRVRFTFWGAEEDGLIGSQHYVDSLAKSEPS